MATWVVPLKDLAQRRGGDDPRVVGGKAARLAWLMRQGYAVPEAWVIPQEAFVSVLRSLAVGGETRSLLRTTGSQWGVQRLAEARQQLVEAQLPKELSAELLQLWTRVKDSVPWGLAVRSSATCEDGDVVSMAGIAATHLGVRGAEELSAAVRSVWASMMSPRAIAYLANHGQRDFGMAVVVQRVVPAECAGVLFTRAPDTRRESDRERVINAAFGLGVPLVEGVANPDILRIDTRGRLVDSILAEKKTRLVVGPRGLEEVANPVPTAPALSRKHLSELADVALRLEKTEAGPWDVEFVCDREKVWIVQARPVTGQGFPDGGQADTVWTNANVGEALPGLATPLTWSVAGAFSEAGFAAAFETLGCKVPKGVRLVGNVHGRFYLNLTGFMRVAAQVPWLNPRTLVDLGGGAGGDWVSEQSQSVSKRGFFLRMPVTVTRLVKEQVRLDGEVARYEELAERERKRHTALDLAILTDDGLARKIRDVQALLARTGTVMLTCASSSLASYMALRFLLERVDPIEADRMAQSLTSGIRDLESARPAIALQRIATLAQGEPDAKAALLDENTTGMDAIPEGQTKRAIASFLDLYGDRAVREAELSTPRWNEDSRTVLTMIRVALRGERADMERILIRGQRQADEDWARLFPRLGFVEQIAVRHLIARAQKAARLREVMRAWVTRVLGMLRHAFLDADRRLMRREPDLNSDQRVLVESKSPIAGIGPSFFLTIDEVVHALRTGRSDLTPIVRARRAEYLRDLARPDPPSTFVGTPPPLVLLPTGGDVVRGLPAGPGVVEGPARVLRGIHEAGLLEAGEILVVRTTDVGWTPLFPMAAGVVTELGGPLSHAAIVAREFGIPTVVNAEGATRVFRTGDRLRLDGDRGVVERLLR